MEREILTYPLTKEQVRDELMFCSEYFSKQGAKLCEVLFGFAWGNQYYPSAEWPYEKIKLSELPDKVRTVENSGIGSLGTDDLFVKIRGLQFRFCNDSDIHIYFTEPCEDIEYFYSRWKQLGYQPAEWLKNQENGPGERIRFD